MFRHTLPVLWTLLVVVFAAPEVAATEPTADQVARLRGSLDLAHANRIPEAMEQTYQLLQDVPDYVEAHRLYIDLLASQGRAEDAVHFYRLALNANPGSAAAHYLYGRATNEPTLAEAEFREALELDPDFAWAHHGLGAALALKGDLEGALAAFEHAIALRADLPEAHNHLANLLLGMEREDEAIAAYRRAIELAPDEADAYFYLGTYFAHHERLGEAIELLEDAVRLDGNNPMYHLELGCVYFDLHRDQEALAAFDEGLRADPREEYLRDMRAAAAEVVAGNTPREMFGPFRRGLEAVVIDPSTALAEFEEAISLAPEFHLSHLNRGIVLAALERPVEAEEAVRRALALEPRYPESQASLAVVLMADQRYAEAEASLQQALALDPAHVEALRGMGMVYLLQERPELAASYFLRASKLSTADLGLQVEMAGAFVQSGDLARAEETLRAVVRADPRFNFARHQLAALLVEQERYGEGIAELEELKKHVSTDALVQQLIDQVKAQRRAAERETAPRMRLAQILVKDRALADDLAARAAAGEDFGHMARSYSVGPTASDGGDIGEVLAADLNPLMADALDGVPVGGVSRVIEIPAGFVLLKWVK